MLTSYSIAISINITITIGDLAHLLSSCLFLSFCQLPTVSSNLMRSRSVYYKHMRHLTKQQINSGSMSSVLDMTSTSRSGQGGQRQELRDISDFDNSVSGLSSKNNFDNQPNQFPQSQFHSNRLQSFTSSRPSSPFVSNTDLPSAFNEHVPTDEIRFQDPNQIADPYQAKDVTDDFDITDQTDDIDKSIASLQKSLADVKINTNSLKSLREQKSPTKKIVLNERRLADENPQEVSMDTTRDNETQNQFDQDIELDNSDSTSKHSFAHKLKASPTSNTPWRKFRSSASSLPLNIPPTPQLRFGTPDLNIKSSGHDTNTSSNNTIDELNKQLTGYKIQIRLFKQFLQKIIENNDINDDIFNSNEMSQLQNNFNNLSPIGKGRSPAYLKNSEFIRLEKDYNELSQNYDEIYKLNEDLYVNLEEFQTKLVEKDNQIKRYNQILLDSSSITHDILLILINDTYNTDVASKKALTKCVEDSDNKPLDLNLSIIKMELNKRLDYKRNSFSSSSGSTKVFEYEKDKASDTNNYIQTIHQLMATLEQLKNEYENLKQITANLQQELQHEIDETNKLKVNYSLIQQHLNEVTKTLNMNNFSTQEEIITLTEENQRLSTVNQTINNKFEEYQQIIDQLQQEVNEFKDSNHNNTLTELNEELLQSHRDFNELQEEYNDLHTRYIKVKEDSSNTVSSLTNQLHELKQDKSTIKKSDTLAFEKLQQELNLAVEKQRVLKAEKVRLSYKADSLTKDKISLQATIQNLTDKITDLTVSADNSKPSELDHSLIKRTNILEYQIGELLRFDTLRFQQLMTSFNKVNDDFSLKLPTRKIDYMLKKLIPNNSSTDSDISGVDFTDMNNIKDYHKSVFDYIIRATKTVVDKYITLYLLRGQESDYVNQLHERIYQLSKMNDEITNLIDSTEVLNPGNNSSMESPRSKLRIDELTNRWKAEREARVYENNEAKRRLAELELENSRLIEQLQSYDQK